MDGLLAELARRVPPTGLLGYLNFSDGRSDPRWQKALNAAYAFLATHEDTAPWLTLRAWLLDQLEQLHTSGAAAFRDCEQARAVVSIAFGSLLEAYRHHHADLLAHQPDSVLFAPFFLVRCAEAVLRQGSPWEETERILRGALAKLNDFVGHRPIALLETRPQTDFYPHEKVRPIPLWIRSVGSAYGPYGPLIEAGIELVRQTPAHLLAEATFDIEQLDEVAMDPRAYDHHHPANRRPNYLFGEWDPHFIDSRGLYRRFVLRQVTLDALLERIASGGVLQPPIVPPAAVVEAKSPLPAPAGTPNYDPKSELFLESAAVLAGTLLMASAVSGNGPATHDSGVTLSTLVPRVARIRDQFYESLIEKIPGSHGERLREEAKRLRQPFGGVRQYLNQSLARQRAMQLQERQLALLFAEMGYPEASRERARRIPTASVRILSEIRLRQTAAELAIERDRGAIAQKLLAEVEDLVRRGIDCGALADPWNILGYQGLYPLFQSREDSIRDPRNEELIHTVGRQFDLYARLLATRSVMQDNDLRKKLRRELEQLAAWWDRYATSEVSELPRVHGGERMEAAIHVAESLARWQQRTESGNDIAFWRQHREGFRSPAAFAQVVEALLRQKDWRAALSLLMAWLAQADTIALEETSASFQQLSQQWLQEVLRSTELQPAERANLVRRFFDLMEANADSFWEVPESFEGRTAPIHEAGEDEDSPNDLFRAAYEDVTFRDSADDGEEGAVIGGGPDLSTEDDLTLEKDSARLTQRLQFLTTVARLWCLATRVDLWAEAHPDDRSVLAGWLQTARAHSRRLPLLIQSLFRMRLPEPTGGFESVVDYERKRTVRDQLIEAAIATQVETSRAVRKLSALLLPMGELPPATPVEPSSAPMASTLGEVQETPVWETAALRLERAILLSDIYEVRRVLPAVLLTVGKQPILFTPLAEGGEPNQISAARSLQALIISWLQRLPRLGLLRETYHLVRMAKQMERNQPTPGKKVSEFDRIFRIGLRGVVGKLLDAAVAWDQAGIRTETAKLAEMLRQVSDSFLSLWIAHSQTLRLSVLESVTGNREWESLKTFIRHYGRDLFTPQFLTPANLRGILHQGVGHWLDTLMAQPEREMKLLQDLDQGILVRERAIPALELVMHAVLENYDEYRDYNTTTAQSDYGDNLHLLIDFLRLKMNYDRYAWRMRPLSQAHEVLCRKGHNATADRWQESIGDYTKKLSTQLLDELARLEATHGLRLRTVRDRLEERFLQPLLLDKLCASVEPAIRAAQRGENETNPAFVRLLEQLEPLAATPVGVGLDVPHWLRRLEAEIHRVRHGAPDQDDAGDETPSLPLSQAELQQQLEDWEKPLN